MSGFGFTGYLLPWDQKAYWATTVGTRIAGVAPVVGDWILRIARGGPELSAVTLARFFGTHVWVLPAALGTLLLVHLYLVIRVGISSVPERKEGAMNEKDKKEYLERYKQAKEKGVPFFPDIVFKDAIASLVIFLILAALAYFVGVPMEARADPNDANYTPRPEWYFLFLFQLLKYFPGQLEFIGAMLLPGLFILLLLALPFIDRNPKRHFLNRPLASVAAVLVVAGILTLTVLSVREAPPPQIASATDRAAQLYAQNCANCHGPAIEVSPATDLHQLIAEGKHEGMPAWGGDLSTDEIDALAGFITSPNGSARVRA